MNLAHVAQNRDKRWEFVKTVMEFHKMLWISRLCQEPWVSDGLCFVILATEMERVKELGYEGLSRIQLANYRMYCHGYLHNFRREARRARKCAYTQMPYT
jgi:hypothetical protein